METTVLIAKIIGILYLSFGVGMLFNTEYYSKAIENLLESPTYLILGGFLAVIIGVLIIEYHNIWAKNWTVLITIIGWIALVKGIFLAFPKSFKIYKPMFKSKKVINFLAIFVILFGVIFCYFGFFL